MLAVTPVNTPNNTQNFLPIGDAWRMEPMKIKASTALAMWTALWVEVSASNPTGYLIAMPATNANGQNFVWILMEKVSSTDPDYATAGKTKIVAIPKSLDALAKFKVVSWTFNATTDIGRVAQFASSWTGLAVNTNGAWAIIRWYIDANYGTCSFDVAKAVTA